MVLSFMLANLFSSSPRRCLLTRNFRGQIIDDRAGPKTSVVADEVGESLGPKTWLHLVRFSARTERSSSARHDSQGFNGRTRYFRRCELRESGKHVSKLLEAASSSSKLRKGDLVRLPCSLRAQIGSADVYRGVFLSYSLISKSSILFLYPRHTTVNSHRNLSKLALYLLNAPASPSEPTSYPTYRIPLY